MLLTSRHVGPVADMMAEAFFDDPVMQWLFPNPDKRQVKLSRMFAANTKHHCLRQRASAIEYAPDGQLAAAILWNPPGRWKPSPWAQLRMTPTYLRVLGSQVKRGQLADEALKGAHPTQPHWYLSQVGSSQMARGRGYAGRLIRDGIERCDAEHMPAYLESSKVANIPYYEKFGFKQTGEIVLSDGGPTAYPMWRDPA